MSDAEPRVMAATAPVRVASLRATRAHALAIASRIALAVLLVGVAWSFVIVADRSAAAPPTLGLARVADAEGRAGLTMSALVDAVQTSVERQSGGRFTLEVGRPELRSAPVRISGAVSGDTAAAVERLTDAFADAGIGELVPRTITPTPSGAVVELDGRVRLSSVALAPRTVGTRPIGVELADAVEGAGSTLRRIAVPVADDDALVLEARGRIGPIIGLLAVLERDHTAPMRFVQLRLRPVVEPSDAEDASMMFDLTAAFHLREVSGARPADAAP